MKKLLLSLLAAFMISPLAHADFPDYYNEPNEQFHPRNENYYESDNEWLKRKTRADIERASRPAVHFDQEAQDYYRCDWNFNKNLGTWVCDKDQIGGGSSRSYNQPTAVTICPYGYQPNPWNTGCVKVNIPANAVLNQQGNGWDCQTGYRLNSAYTGCVSTTRYVVINEPTPTPAPKTIVRYIETKAPDKLPSTGGSLPLATIATIGLVVVRKLRQA